MINLKKERLETPIYFNIGFDLDSMREEFEQDIRTLLDRYKIENGDIYEK